ncbi:hypothetical protein FRC00_006123 [Tulasnella sp. 408]|nr:hypothetical protein FRC00_006123 [Tulasnella sp. 408]
MTDDYPLLETLFELIFVLRPRASAPLLREAYLKKLLHNPFGVETLTPKATRQLYQIISDAKDSNMPQGDGTIGLMEVPLSTILELQVLRPQAEILGGHSPADDVNTLRSPLIPIPDDLKLQYQESSPGTAQYIAPRSLFESRDDIQASGSVDLLANPNCSDNGPNRRLSQLRPSKNLQVPLSENLSSIITPTVEASSSASAGLNGVARQLLPTACNDEASLVSQRLAGRKWGTVQAASKREKVQEKTPQGEGFLSEPKADQVKDTISDTTPVIESQPSRRVAARNKSPTDLFGIGPYLSNLEVNRLAQGDITKSKTVGSAGASAAES